MNCSNCNTKMHTHVLWIIPKENILLKDKRLVCDDCIPIMKNIYGKRSDRFIEIEKS